MEVELGQIVNLLAEAITQKKEITEEATVAVGTVGIKGRKYQVQVTLEPILAKHLEPLSVVSGGKVVVEDSQTLFPEVVEGEIEAEDVESIEVVESETVSKDE